MRNPSVSDHAVLRYLERHYKLDILKIRQEILRPEVIAAIRAGAIKVKIDGMEYPIVNGVIVTSTKKATRKKVKK